MEQGRCLKKRNSPRSVWDPPRIGWGVLAFFFVGIMDGAEGHALPMPEQVPPRTRACCALGADLRLRFGAMRLPIRIPNIVDPANLGEHCYSRPNLLREKNGIVYTCRGGFLDIAHVRETADWTAHLFERLRILVGSGRRAVFPMADGVAQLQCSTRKPAKPHHDLVALLLSQRAAYYIAVWHEIVTYYGAGATKLFPEYFSAFSSEDLYSDLVGTYVGAVAVGSALPFERAVDAALGRWLRTLRAVPPAATRTALVATDGALWHSSHLIPEPEFLPTRNFKLAPPLRPILVSPIPGCEGGSSPHSLSLPERAPDGASLKDYCTISFTAPESVQSELSEAQWASNELGAAVRTVHLPATAPLGDLQGFRLLSLHAAGSHEVGRDGPTSIALAIVGAQAQSNSGDLRLVESQTIVSAQNRVMAQFRGVHSDELYFCADADTEQYHLPIAAWFQTCRPKGWLNVGATVAQALFDARNRRVVLRPLAVNVGANILNSAFSSAYFRRHWTVKLGMTMDSSSTKGGEYSFSPRLRLGTHARLRDRSLQYEAEFLADYLPSLRSMDNYGIEAGVRLGRRWFMRPSVDRPPDWTAYLGVELGYTYFAFPDQAIHSWLLSAPTPSERSGIWQLSFFATFDYENWGL